MASARSEGRWQRAEDRRRRVCHRQPAERTRAGRPLAADRYPSRSVEAPRRFSPDFTDASRPVGGISSAGAMDLTVTASTTRPVRLSFAEIPQASALWEMILQRIPDALYHNDVHGKPDWRKHMTLRLAEEIRCELQCAARP